MEKLAIFWATGDIEVANEIIIPYAFNSMKYGWWEEVRLIIWGPSEKLVASEPELEEEIAKLKKAGVIIEACKQCAENYFVDNVLTEMGIDVKYMGSEFTQILKSDYKVVTF